MTIAICNARRDHDVTLSGYHPRMSVPEREKHFIRAWREYRGLSLRKFAGLLESSPGVPLMSHANIGRIEKGEQPYTQDFLEAAARALEVEPADLLTKDPTKEGEVVDLLRIIAKRKDDEQTMAVLRALAGRSN